jgi:hypothetical protein
MSAIVCGLDVHKDSTYATVMNHEGKIVNQTKMRNERVLSYLSGFKVDRVAMVLQPNSTPLQAADERRLHHAGFPP